MDASVIALIDRGARFTFRGDPFRRRQWIPNEDVVDIDFSRVEIGDADVVALEALTALEGISFWNTAITDQSIERIKHLHQLVRINLCGTHVTDASVPTLIAMQLEYIDVADTFLTPGGLELLREGLPNAEILS